MGRSTGAKAKLNSEQTQKIVEIVINRTLDEVGFIRKKKLDNSLNKKIGY